MRLLIIFLYLISINISSQEDQVEYFDLRSYDPVKNGLKDLYCEVRIKGLTEQLKKEFLSIKFGEEVYYKMYWLYPGKLDFEIEGIPRGFLELKTNLKNLVVNRVDYIIPQSLGKRLRSYQKKSQKTKGGYLVEANDPTNTKAVNKIELRIDDEGRMKSYKSYSPLGFQESKFTYGKKSWSKNKWVLEKVIAKAIQGPQVTEVTTEITYKNQVGLGLPIEIEVGTKQFIVAPGKDERKLQREGETEITIGNFKVNSAEAQGYFRKQE